MSGLGVTVSGVLGRGMEGAVVCLLELARKEQEGDIVLGPILRYSVLEKNKSGLIDLSKPFQAGERLYCVQCQQTLDPTASRPLNKYGPRTQTQVPRTTNSKRHKQAHIKCQKHANPTSHPARPASVPCLLVFVYIRE